MDPSADSSKETIPTKAQVPPLTGLSSQELKAAADYLLDNHRIGCFKQRYEKYRRYAPLYCNQMYTELVTLYATMFKSQWQHFRRMIDGLALPAGVTGQIYLARIYISHWFHDLYCANREATRSVSPIAFNELYEEERVPFSNEYDQFLVLLNASIRPTHIQLIPEDGLYIPKFGDNLDWTGIGTNLNPFAITDFNLNHDMFLAILHIMKERKEWKMAKTMTNTIGRPCWLFDWHENTCVCAWFPREGNYTDTDVALAYITGVACTPKLGLVDADDWHYSATALPANTDPHPLPRIQPRRFHGAYEVRTLEVDGNYYLPEVVCQLLDTSFPDFQKKRKKSRSSGATSSAMVVASNEPAPTQTATTTIDIPNTPRYRILDWCYYSRDILYTEWHTRTGALRYVAFN